MGTNSSRISRHLGDYIAHDVGGVLGYGRDSHMYRRSERYSISIMSDRLVCMFCDQQLELMVKGDRREVEQSVVMSWVGQDSHGSRVVVGGTLRLRRTHRQCGLGVVIEFYLLEGGDTSDCSARVHLGLERIEEASVHMGAKTRGVDDGERVSTLLRILYDDIHDVCTFVYGESVDTDANQIDSYERVEYQNMMK
ncbi:hypothetical protein Tco_1026345 [Tanacetum coccineum]